MTRPLPVFYLGETLLSRGDEGMEELVDTKGGAKEGSLGVEPLAMEAVLKLRLRLDPALS